MTRIRFADMIRFIGSNEYRKRTYLSWKDFRTMNSGAPISEKTTVEELAQKIKALEQSEIERKNLQAKLANAMEMAQLAPWEYDAATDVFTFNDHFYKIYRTTAREVGGYTLTSSEYGRRFVHPDDLQQFKKEIRFTVEATDPNFSRQLEHRILYADGTVGYITVRYFIVKDSLSRTVKSYGVNQDITDRKRSEEALQKSEMLLRTLIRTLPDLVWLKDPEGIYLFCNSRFERFFGAKEEEITGKTDYDFLAKDLADFFRRHDHLAMIKGRPSRNEEEVIFADDGHHEILETIKTPMFRSDGELIGVLGIGRDITERKRVEEALRHRIEFERLISKISSELAAAGGGGMDTAITRALGAIGAFTDADRSYVFQLKGVESRMANTHEWCADGVEPQIHHLQDILIEEELPWFFRHIRKHKIFHIPDVSALPPEARLERNHFEAQNIQSVLVVSMEIAGKLKGFIGFDAVRQRRNWGEDDQNLLRFLGETICHVIERNRAEEALRQSEEKLGRSRKMESMGLLAGGVAHDLNNILSGIVSYPDLLLMDLPEDSRLRKPIITMRECGQRAAAIVQDLLTIARGVAIEKQPLNLNDIIDNYIASPEHKKLLQYHPTVRVEVDLDPHLLNIKGSPVHVGKTIMNLVSNAAEAISGNGKIRLKTINRYLDRPLKGYDDVTTGEYAVLVVADNGPGILPDDLERIFEPFYSRKVMGRSGTGLGLAVVWNVMRDHKGYINVMTGGSGATFELYFPVTRDELWEKDKPLSFDAFRGSGETVLVVDDEENQREILCKMLDILGYKSISVPSGEKAVAYLKDNPVELLLLDMIMTPGINGRETFERIITLYPNQRAVIVSGFAETQDVRIAQQLGAGRYLKKPIQLEKLGLAIKAELAK
ncbi:MAG: PAS domain S-box protein [Pseudomonadota bacterium]